jgi:hypothetical protein
MFGSEWTLEVAHDASFPVTRLFKLELGFDKETR